MNEKAKTINAYPVKDYFISTITKDVDLEDCVLDLLDNCIDGARRVIAKSGGGPEPEKPYQDFEANIVCAKDYFNIIDNCGGIPLDYAIDYAFYFGRRPDAPEDAGSQIGLYGIGMKRAIFKIGKQIEIETSTKDLGYRVPINVPAWQKKPDVWEFDFEDAKTWEHPGTTIVIKDLNEEAVEEFALGTFLHRLIRTIARDYSFFLQKGFKVTVNGFKVEPYEFRLREGADFKPVNIKYYDEIEKDVAISIAAGMADIPPTDETPEELDKIREADYYGWFVACNDRIVLPGDKSVDTVWGHDGFPRWHTQYYGFMGIVNFVSSDPRILPWTTTKRDLNPESALYRRAVTKMKEVTRVYINYTNERKANLEKAKEAELKAEPKPLHVLSKSDKIILPRFERKPRVKMANILYQKPQDLVRKVAESLGHRNMPYKDVGIQTFDYYVDNEVEEE